MSDKIPKKAKPVKKTLKYKVSKTSFKTEEMIHQALIMELSRSVLFSIISLEEDEGSIMPHILINDAFLISEMLIVAKGLEPDEHLVREVMFNYLKLHNYLNHSLSNSLMTECEDRE